MATVLLSLGSNIGDKRANLLGALKLLAQSLGTVRQSRVYETEPWHVPSHPRYLNLCVRFETDLQPEELLKLCKKIERKFSRNLSKKLAPRPLDIDIIFYDDLVYESDNLTIPHPRLHMRRFVLQPLSDISPDFIHPIFKKTVSILLHECDDKGEVKEISSDRMQMEI